MPNAAHQSLTEPSTCAGKFCVYSSPEFNNGRGITFITAKQAMDDIRTLPIFHAANETSGLQSKGPSPRLNGKPPSTQSESDDPPFRITEVPGKGLGVVATRPIVRGQRIMRHPPTVVVHRQFVDDLSEEEQARLLDSAIATLPSSTRDVFDAQVGHAGGSKVVDIMLTNSFEMSLAIPADRHHSGNFPEISRYNHDCRPNVQFYIDKTMTHYTHAVKGIQRGEELTISYVDPFTARSVRQDRARRSWGFECTCAHCSLPKELARKSDDRLWQIYEVENRIADWNSTIDMSDIELLLSLYKQESLDQSHASDALVHAALNYNALAEEELATRYAQLALEAGMLEKGPKSRHVQTMRQLLKDPKEHWSWRRRIRG